MYLLIDECCAKCLVRYATAAGHTAQRSVHVRGLGYAAPDADIFRFAVRGGAVLVTENLVDFLALACGRSHPGMIILPTVRPRAQAALFERVLGFIGSPAFTAGMANRFVEILENGQISSFQA